MQHGKAILFLIVSAVSGQVFGMGQGIDGYIPPDFKGGPRREKSHRRLVMDLVRASLQSDHTPSDVHGAQSQRFGEQWLENNINVSSCLAAASSTSKGSKRTNQDVVKTATSTSHDYSKSPQEQLKYWMEQCDSLPKKKAFIEPAPQKSSEKASRVIKKSNGDCIVLAKKGSGPVIKKKDGTVIRCSRFSLLEAASISHQQRIYLKNLAARYRS